MKKLNALWLTLGYIGTFLAMWGINWFFGNSLMTLPLGARMAAMPAAYLLIALPAFIIMLICRDKPCDYGFSRQRIGTQIAVGVSIALVMSLLLTVVSILCGREDWVSTGKNYRYLWQFAYEFVYCIVAVGLAEEFVFRGFVFAKLKALGGTTLAIIGSSVLFGLFHIFSGNIAQLFLTAAIGAVLCLCREKLRGCTTLSLIIAHGVYDALITVWNFLL